MTVFYQCQLCKEQAEAPIKTRHPPHWATVTIEGPRAKKREYDLCHPCTTELAELMNIDPTELESDTAMETEP